MAECRMSIKDFEKKLKDIQKCTCYSEERKVDRIRKLIQEYANTHDKILLLKSEIKDGINDNPINMFFVSVGFCVSLYSFVVSSLLQIDLCGVVKIIAECVAFALMLLMVIFSTKFIYTVSKLNNERKYAFLLEQLIEEHETNFKKNNETKN